MSGVFSHFKAETSTEDVNVLFSSPEANAHARNQDNMVDFEQKIESGFFLLMCKKMRPQMPAVVFVLLMLRPQPLTRCLRDLIHLMWQHDAIDPMELAPQ